MKRIKRDTIVTCICLPKTKFEGDPGCIMIDKQYKLVNNPIKRPNGTFYNIICEHGMNHWFNSNYFKP